MKKQLYLYLFIFTALILLFFIVNTKKDTKHLEDKLAKIETRLTETTQKYQDTIGQLQIEVMEKSSFSLSDDPYAIELLYKDDIDYKELTQHVQDQLIDLNFKKEGNPLVPYDAMNGGRMMINSIKMLNHKWVIADFTDGKYWGQILIKVFYNDNKTMSFETSESFLYPFDVTK